MTAEEQKEYFADALDLWGDEFCTEFIRSCNRFSDDGYTMDGEPDGGTYYMVQIDKDRARFVDDKGNLLKKPFPWRNREKACFEAECFTCLTDAVMVVYEDTGTGDPEEFPGVRYREIGRWVRGDDEE